MVIYQILKRLTTDTRVDMILDDKPVKGGQHRKGARTVIADSQEDESQLFDDGCKQPDAQDLYSIPNSQPASSHKTRTGQRNSSHMKAGPMPVLGVYGIIDHFTHIGLSGRSECCIQAGPRAKGGAELRSGRGIKKCTERCTGPYVGWDSKLAAQINA